MQIDNRIGDRIKEARELKGLTLSKVARNAGVTTKTMSNWEANQSQPRANKLQVLSGVLGVPLIWLLEGNQKFDPSLAWSSRIEKIERMMQKLNTLQLEVKNLSDEIAMEIAAVRQIEQNINEYAN